MVQEYIPIDRALADAVLLDISVLRGATQIAFQFPPKITSDGRKGDWEEKELRGTEPVAVFKTSGPREISLTWTYIVDGGQWTTTRIKEQIRRLRAYFALVRDRRQARNLVGRFKMWKVGGNAPITVRVKSIDVKYGDTIIAPGGRTDDAMFLRTDITVELRLWTKGGRRGRDARTQDLGDLSPTEPADWY